MDSDASVVERDTEVGLNQLGSSPDAAQKLRSYANKELTGYLVQNLLGKLVDVLRYLLEVIQASLLLLGLVQTSSVFARRIQMSFSENLGSFQTGCHLISSSFVQIWRATETKTNIQRSLMYTKFRWEERLLLSTAGLFSHFASSYS